MIEKLPKQFLERLKILLGSDFENYIKYIERKDNNASIRPNKIKISDNDFEKIFKEKLGDKIEWEFAFLIKDKKFFSKTPYYHTGIYYIQEASSMLPVNILDPKPGEVILDACASPGSKTTQIASKMLNSGIIIANEVKPSRIGRLIENIARAGVKNCIVTNEELDNFKFMEEYFDKILVDAPCSGEGMFKRDKEAIKIWSPNLVKTLSGIQKKILKDIAPLLKIDGVLVYSTCTMSIKENEENIDWFIKNYPFELQEIEYGTDGFRGFEDREFLEDIKKTKRIFPYKNIGDPFFVAKMVKKDRVKNHNSLNKKTTKNYGKFEKSTKINQSFEKIGIKIKKDTKIKIFGNDIYDTSYIFEETLNKMIENRIKVAYSGVKIGKIKKDRVEPEYPLAMSIPRENINEYNYIDLCEEDAIKYLRGETLDIKIDKGYYIVTYNKYPIGWLKYSDSMKNLFPHHIRGKI